MAHTIQQDGFSTIIAFAAISTPTFKEKEVNPPGVDMGDKIDISTMRNAAWKTFVARKLKELTEFTVVCSYDAAFMGDANTNAGVNTLCTITFPDTATYVFYAYIKKWDPKTSKSGDQPEGTLTIQPTLVHSTTGAETAPVYTAPA